jgi:uncharacterized repeat protein (TIGR01451 family)
VLTGLLALLLCGVLAGAAQAVPLTPTDNPLPGSNFQGGDGDQKAEGAFDDWETLVGSMGLVSTNDPNALDSTFDTGSHENDPEHWDISTQADGVTPAKANFFNSWTYVDDQAHTFLYLAFDREESGGNVLLAFELNQDTRAWINASGDAIQCRTTGDIIISYEIQNDDTIDVIVQRWVTAEAVTAADVAAGYTNGLGCAKTGTFEEFDPPITDVQGAINAGQVIENFLPGGPEPTIGEELFGEAAIDLTDIFAGAGLSPCFSFGQISLHGRSSESDSASMQDLVGPVPLLVRNCTASGVKYNDLNGDGDRDAGEPGLAGFRIWADYDNDGVLDAGEPFDDTDANGNYSISGIQDPSGTYSLREMLTPPATGTGTWICSQPTTTGTNGVFPCAYTGIDGNATPNVTGKDFGNFKPGKIELAKVADDGTVSAGDQIGFTLTVTNTGAGLAHDVTLTDTLPSNAGLSWSEDPDNTDCTISAAGVLSCDFGDLAPGASASVHVSSLTTFASCGDIPNTGFADSNGSGSDDDSDTVTVQCPDLDLTKTADAASVSAGEQIGFVIKVTNDGPGVAKDVTLNDPLPTGTGVVWTDDNADCTISAANVLHCEFGDLADDESVSVHVTSPTTAASCKAYPNTASLSADNHPDLEASATTTVLCGDIEIEKDADDASVNAGEDIGFTIKVTNTGAGTAKDVEVTDTLPDDAGLSWSEDPEDPDCSITAGVLKCEFGDMAPGAIRSVHISSPTTDDSCGEIENVASVSTSNDGSDEASDSTFVDCPAIAVEKDGPATAYHGDQVTFTYKVSNPGNVALTDVEVVDDKCSPVQGPSAGDANDDDALDPGEVWSYSCTMSIAPHQDGEANPIVNTVTATGTDRHEQDHTATDTHSTQILHQAIDIEKTGPATATVGAALDYTLTVTNPGDTSFPAQQVIVTDPKCEAPPAGPNTGTDATPGTLDPGDTWTYTCRAQTAGQQAGTFVNTANVAGKDTNGRDATDTDDFPTLLEAQVVLPQPEIVNGTARLRGPSGCVRGPFKATVRGSRISRVTFFVDGKRFKQITAPNGEGSRFTVSINPRGRGFGVHRVTARVEFAAASQTQTRTLRLSFQRCKKQVVKPRFTG